MLPVFVPAPSQIVDEVMERARRFSRPISGRRPGRRACGYAIAAAITVTAAAIAVSVRALYGTVYNIGVTLQAIPIIATAPLVALWFGTGPQVQIAIAALASQFPMLVGTMQGLQASDARQRELMHVLSAIAARRCCAIC